MRSLLIALFFVSCVSSVQAQGVAYTGDMGSIDRAMLESLSQAAPEVRQSPYAQANPAVQQVAHQQAMQTQKPAEKKSSFFSKMKPTWLFGEEKQMEAPAPKDPFLAASPRMKASPIATQTAQQSRVANAAFEKQVSRAPAAKQQVNRASGIAMRPTSKPTGLFNQLGLAGQSKPSANKPMPTRTQAAAVRQAPRPMNARPLNTQSVAPAFVGPAITNKAPMVSPSMEDLPVSFATDRQTISAAKDGVAGFGKPSAVVIAEEPSELSFDDACFVSDDTSVAVAVKTVVEEVTEPAGEPVMIQQETVQQAVVEPLTAEYVSDMIVAPAVVLPVVTERVAEPVLSAAIVAESLVEPAALPAVEVSKASVAPSYTEPKPIVSVVKEPVVLATPPTPNPFAATRPIQNPNKQPSERSRALLAEAHGMAEYAASREEFTAIIQRCRYVLAIDDSRIAVDYANELASWGLNKRGELLLDQSRQSEATVDFNDAINCNAECWQAEHNLGVLKAQAGDYDFAARHFDRTLALNPEFAKAYANRAALAIQSGGYEEALKDYQRAIEVDPDLAMAHTGRGRVSHMLGYLEQALRHLDAAEVLSPNESTISLARGDLLVDLGRYGQARQAYEQAIVLDPTKPNAYRNLAWMLATCPVENFRNGEEALANAKLARELTNEADDITLDTHAAALAAVGRFDEAIPMIQEAIEIAPETDAAVYEERLVLYERGEAFTSEAVDLIQSATFISDESQGTHHTGSVLR